MRRLDPYAAVRMEAELLLEELDITSLPVDPFEIARKLDIELMAMPSMNGGASGMFLHVDGVFGIGFPTHVDNEGFKRFSVAHELGHYRLSGHIDAVVGPDGRHQSHAGFVNGDRYEKEADNFASALLMPSGLFSKAMRSAGNGLEAIETLRELCQTSIEATAIRYTQCSRDPIAIVRSQGKTIDYASMSNALKDFPNLTWIKKNTPLPDSTVTAEFSKDPEKIRAAVKESGKSNLDLWFDGCGQEIVEEVIGLGNYGKTLTVLTGMEPPDEIEDDEDDLEEAWTPRFRR